MNETSPPAEPVVFKMPTLGAMLPEIEAAGAVYEAALSAPISTQGKFTADLEAATKAYNEVLERACQAAWEDTQHVNSLSTLRQVFAPKDEPGSPPRDSETTIKILGQ